MSRVTFKYMAKAALSDPWAWRDACIKAKADGWTEGRVMRVLWVVHPFTWIVIVMPICLIVFGLIFGGRK